MSENLGIYDFGVRLKELREIKGLTQKEVAEKLDLQVNSISRYENNTQLPTVDKLKELALIYNTSVDYMLGISNRKNIYIDDLTDKTKALIIDIVDRIVLYEEENKKD